MMAQKFLKTNVGTWWRQQADLKRACPQVLVERNLPIATMKHEQHDLSWKSWTSSTAPGRRLHSLLPALLTRLFRSFLTRTARAECLPRRLNVCVWHRRG